MMLHHIALEVRPDQMADEGEFWIAVGFDPVAAPEALGPGFLWYEKEGTQVHLMETENPATPPERGHLAVVADPIDAAVARLESIGTPLSEGRRLWGERRFKATTPAGHVVELMAAPPAPAGSAS